MEVKLGEVRGPVISMPVSRVRTVSCRASHRRAATSRYARRARRDRGRPARPRGRPASVSATDQSIWAALAVGQVPFPSGHNKPGARHDKADGRSRSATAPRSRRCQPEGAECEYALVTQRVSGASAVPRSDILSLRRAAPRPLVWPPGRCRDHRSRQGSGSGPTESSKIPPSSPFRLCVSFAGRLARYARYASAQRRSAGPGHEEGSGAPCGGPPEG